MPLTAGFSYQYHQDWLSGHRFMTRHGPQFDFSVEPVPDITIGAYYRPDFDDFSSGGSNPPVDDRAVAARHRPCHELGGERLVGRRRLGDDQEPGRVLVEPMNDAGAPWAAHARSRWRMGEHRRRQRAGRVARTGVHHHADRLVDDEHGVVLEDDRQRDRLGLERLRRRRRDLDLDALTVGHAV